jgi:hypothetical protein
LLRLPGPFGFNRNDCSASAEISVRLRPKSVYDLGRNRCSACSELAVRFRPLYTLRRQIEGANHAYYVLDSPSLADAE